MSYADLHTHSTASDGLYSPVKLAVIARSSGVRILAVTDHDTAAGSAQLLRQCAHGVTVISGVELSCITGAGKCHILGLGCRQDAPEFIELMSAVSALRRDKLEARLRYISALGLQLPEAEKRRLRSMPGPGKPQVADALVRAGLSPDVETAIREIVDRCPPVRDRIDAVLAVRAVLASGGQAVWAHPYGETGKKELTRVDVDAMLLDLVAAGITGIECWYSKYTVGRCLELEDMAAGHGLLVSGGSDCHGRPSTAPVGVLNCEGVDVDPERLTVLEKLL